MIWYMYILWKDFFHQLSTSVTSHIYILCVNPLKFYSLCRCQLYNTILQLESPCWDPQTYSWKFIPFYHPLPIFPNSPAPVTTILLFFYKFSFLVFSFSFYISVSSHCICFSLSSFFLKSQVPSREREKRVGYSCPCLPLPHPLFPSAGISWRSAVFWRAHIPRHCGGDWAWWPLSVLMILSV